MSAELFHLSNSSGVQVISVFILLQCKSRIQAQSDCMCYYCWCMKMANIFYHIGKMRQKNLFILQTMVGPRLLVRQEGQDKGKPLPKKCPNTANHWPRSYVSNFVSMTLNIITPSHKFVIIMCFATTAYCHFKMFELTNQCAICCG